MSAVENRTVYPNWLHIHKSWQLVMIQLWVSLDLITQRATGSSVVLLALCWPGSGVCSMSSVACRLPRQTCGSQSLGQWTLMQRLLVNGGDTAESLASPLWHSQRLRPTLCNQWVDPQLRRVHAQRNELALVQLHTPTNTHKPLGELDFRPKPAIWRWW